MWTRFLTSDFNLFILHCFVHPFLYWRKNRTLFKLYCYFHHVLTKALTIFNQICVEISGFFLCLPLYLKNKVPFLHLFYFLNNLIFNILWGIFNYKEKFRALIWKDSNSIRHTWNFYINFYFKGLYLIRSNTPPPHYFNNLFLHNIVSKSELH